MMTNRWIPLVALGIVMLFSASEGLFMESGCCMGGRLKIKGTVVKCLEQAKRYDCNHHYFVIKTEENDPQCIKPHSKWLQELKTKMDCGPAFTPSKFRFKFLDEDDEDFEDFEE